MSRSVTVTGQGAASVVPDSAVVRVTASHRAPGVEEACSGVASAVEAIGVVSRTFTEAHRIASADFTVWPAHDHEGRRTGFEARHAMTIGVPDLAAAGRLLAALVAEAGDRLQVDAVSVEVTDPGPAVVRAREAAFADARARAEQLADLAGAALGEVLAVVEGGGRANPREAAPLAAKADAVSFEPGERSITASITVTWRLV